MSYSFTAKQQFFTLAVFLGVGFLLSLQFELLRFLRKTFAGEGTAAIRAQDAVFCVLSFFVLFFSLLSFADGKIRLHLLLTAAAGFLAFRLSVSRILRKILDPCSTAVRRFAMCLLQPFYTAAKRIKDKQKQAAFRFANRKRKTGERDMQTKWKKLCKKRKRDLKKDEKSV